MRLSSWTMRRRTTSYVRQSKNTGRSRVPSSLFHEKKINFNLFEPLIIWVSYLQLCLILTDIEGKLYPAKISIKYENKIVIFVQETMQEVRK